MRHLSKFFGYAKKLKEKNMTDNKDEVKTLNI